jgi:hypothetical protein
MGWFNCLILGYVNSSSGLKIKNALIKDKTNEAKKIKRLCLKLKEEYEEVESHFSVFNELYDIKFKLLVPSQNIKQSDCN